MEMFSLNLLKLDVTGDIQQILTRAVNMTYSHDSTRVSPTLDNTPFNYWSTFKLINTGDGGASSSILQSIHIDCGEPCSRPVEVITALVKFQLMRHRR